MKPHTLCSQDIWNTRLDTSLVCTISNICPKRWLSVPHAASLLLLLVVAAEHLLCATETEGNALKHRADFLSLEIQVHVFVNFGHWHWKLNIFRSIENNQSSEILFVGILSWSSVWELACSESLKWLLVGMTHSVLDHEKWNQVFILHWLHYLRPGLLHNC